MSPHLLLSALRARFGLFVLALVSTVVAATALSLLLPKTYRATVAVLVAEPTPSGGFIAPQERMAYMQTQADIVASDSVARGVVADLNLGQGAKQGGGAPFENWLIADLLRGLRVDTAQSNVIRISYEAADPAVAASRVNAFARAYVDATQDLRGHIAHKSEAVLEEKLATLRADLKQAQAKLTDYQREHGLVSVDEASDVESARLANLSSQLVQVQDQTLDLQVRRQQAHKFMAAGAPLERLQDVQANPQVQRLSSELLQGETRLQDLALQYGVNYPQYRRQAAENLSRRAALDAEMRKVVAGIDNAADQSGRRAAELRAAVNAQRARLLDLKENRNQLAQLARNVDTIQKTYDTAVQRFVVDVAEHRVEQAQVSLLNLAVAPREPHRPKVGLNIAASVAIGALLGLAIVLAMEMADRRVRSPEDLRLSSSAVPLLGVVSRWSPPPQALPGGRLRGLPNVLPDVS